MCVIGEREGLSDNTRDIVKNYLKKTHFQRKNMNKVSMRLGSRGRMNEWSDYRISVMRTHENEKIRVHKDIISYLKTLLMCNVNTDKCKSLLSQFNRDLDDD